MTLAPRLRKNISRKDTKTAPLTHRLTLLLTLLPLPLFAAARRQQPLTLPNKSINSGYKPRPTTHRNATTSYTLHTMVRHTDHSAPTGHH